MTVHVAQKNRCLGITGLPGPTMTVLFFMYAVTNPRDYIPIVADVQSIAPNTVFGVITTMQNK